LLLVVLFAQLQISPRVHAVAVGHAPVRSLAEGSDDRAVVTARGIPGGGAATLRRLGFDAQPLAGDVSLLRLDRQELQRLIAVPNLQVEERRRFFTQLDKAAPAIFAPMARAESGLDGSGVLVGVVDTGADARHADLRHADGTTKIAALLDVSIPSDGRHQDFGAYGGSIWVRDEIDGALAAEAAGQTPPVPFTSVDTQGHGTHVAGIAVSSGLATGNGFPAGRYLGIAPGAELLVAKASHGSGQFSESELLTACRFVVERARLMQQPLVLNLSIGGVGGAHDGTTNTEQALAALIPGDTPGLALVVAAGNEGLTDRHAGGWSLDGEVEIPFHLSQPDRNALLAIDLWSQDSPSITVFTPSGRQLGPVGNTHVDHNDGSEGSIAVDHTTPPRGDGRQQSSIVLTPASGDSLASGDWRIRLSGASRRWDLWITEAAGDARFTDHLDEDDRLGTVATTRTAISVGSFVSRSQWMTVDGNSYDRMIEVGVPSLFSSAGPSADNRFVPDLSAPGEFVLSALSQNALPDQPSSDFFAGNGVTATWADDGVHGVLRGTSQAAPMVAGAVALMFQYDRTLTANQVRELLRTSARDSGAGWSPRTGFGALDVRALLATLRGQAEPNVDAALSSVGVSRDQIPPGEAQSLVTVTPRDAGGLPIGPGHNVTIAISAGQPVGPVVDVGLGRYQRAVVAHAGRGQIGVVTATVDGVTLDAHPRIYYVVSREEIGRPFSAGGGCSLPIGGCSITSLLWLLALAGATLAFRRRSNGCSTRSPRL
jgi:subtilisin family serine protease